MIWNVKLALFEREREKQTNLFDLFLLLYEIVLVSKRFLYITKNERTCENYIWINKKLYPKQMPSSCKRKAVTYWLFENLKI